MRWREHPLRVLGLLSLGVFRDIISSQAPGPGTFHHAACAALPEPDGLSHCAATALTAVLLLGPPEVQGCFVCLLNPLK